MNPATRFPALRRGAAWLLLLTALACHRSSDPAPAGCQVTVTEGSSAISYQFDEQDRLATVRSGNQALQTIDYSASPQPTLKTTYPGDETAYVLSTLRLDGPGRVAAAEETRFQNQGTKAAPDWKSQLSANFTYNAEGQLTDYAQLFYGYPPGQPRMTRTSRVHLRYVANNPVEIVRTEEGGSAPPTVFTSTVSFGSQTNRLRLPLLAENRGLGLHLDARWLGLIGRPSAQLPVRRVVVQDNGLVGTQTYEYSYAYRLDANGQVQQFSYPPFDVLGPVVVASTCP